MNSTRDFLNCPTEALDFGAKESVLPFMGKQWIICCIFNFFYEKQPFSCVTSIKSKEKNVSFHLKMKCRCAHFKFNPELSICTAKLYMYCLKEINFVFIFQTSLFMCKSIKERNQQMCTILHNLHLRQIILLRKNSFKL